MPPDDSDRLEEEQAWIEEHGPIGAGVPPAPRLEPDLAAAMLEIHEGDDER